MTRASAANAEGCPNGLASLGSGDADPNLEVGSRRLIRTCLMAVPGASIGILCVLLALVGLTLHHLRFEGDVALKAAAREVDLSATLLASRLDAGLPATTQASRAGVFRPVLARLDERFATTTLFDPGGRLIAVGSPAGEAGRRGRRG